MKHYPVLSILAGISLFACASTAYAQNVDVPRTISYQGVVTSTDGTPLFDGEHSITVTLYSDPAGTIPVWQDTYNTTTTKGIFNLYLGTNKPLPLSTELNRPLWVGTAINGAQEMRPLTPLTASPYALNLPDHAVTTDKLADGAVTAEKVEMDYVKGFRVNGQEVSGKGTMLDIRGGEGIALNYDETTNVLNVERQSQGTIADPEKTGNLSGSGTDSWAMEGDGVNTSGAPVAADADDWIGTKGNFDFTIKVFDNGTASTGVGRIMQYRPNGTSANILGGHNSNSIGDGVGNVIAGGGASSVPNTIGDYADFNFIGSGQNTMEDGVDASAIVVGQDNTIRESTSYAFIGSGQENSIEESANFSAIIDGQYNDINTFSTHSFIGTGLSNSIGDNSNHSAIVSGESNSIATTSTYNFIGSGLENSIEHSAQFSFIGGGSTNTIATAHSFIGSGLENSIGDDAYFSVIAGGETNLIAATGEHGVIGGGSNNTISSNALRATIGGGELNVIGPGTVWAVIAGGHGHRALSTHSTIGGGHVNLININSGSSTIGGGEDNIISGSNGTIAGGSANIISGSNATIAGGRRNNISEDYVAITGGYNNVVKGRFSAIVGGESNVIETLSQNSLIGGGEQNTIDEQSSWGVVAGGDHNSIATLTDRAVISGGYNNQVSSGANGSVIGGGESNIIDVNSAHSIIGGGSQNSVTGFDNVLGGGLQNIVRANAATISGGLSNTVDGYNGQINGGRENTVTAGGHTGIIVGGHLNRVEALESSVGGGRENKILMNAAKSTIGGGEANEIQSDARYGTVGGGFNNIINGAAVTDPSFLSATIPGGDNLIAQSWAQTVIGGWNLPKGDVSSRYGAGSRKSPIFIIGNGDPGVRKNAFEVSYNGHSTVYHQNGTGTLPTGQAAIRGTTYTDNVVYAWATATPAPGHVDIGCDFGVQNIAYLGLGHYRITMNLEKPEDNGTFTPMNLSCGSVTATIVVPLEEPQCAFINTTAINGNTFDIYISRNVLVVSPQGASTLECERIDLPFTFKVTGSPI